MSEIELNADTVNSDFQFNYSLIPVSCLRNMLDTSLLKYAINRGEKMTRVKIIHR